MQIVVFLLGSARIQQISIRGLRFCVKVHFHLVRVDNVISEIMYPADTVVNPD